jgi:hypothetical protein
MAVLRRSLQVDTLADEGVARIVATASILRVAADKVTLLSVSRDIPTAEGLGAEVRRSGGGES